MLLMHCFNRYVFMVLLLIFSQIGIASVINKECGGKFFRVKILKGIDKFEKRFELYYMRTHGAMKMFYRSKSGISLTIACIQNNKNRYILIFQEFCGGNGCPEDIYGIFDPVQEIMLISPTDWSNGNSKGAEHILGFFPPTLAGDKRSFCCNRNQY